MIYDYIIWQGVCDWFTKKNRLKKVLVMIEWKSVGLHGCDA